MVKVQINAKNTTLIAEFEKNSTTDALFNLMPLQLPMLNLYSRELTYRFKQALPAGEAQRRSYRVGDIAYWTPRHSFVFFYKQTGEIISSLQPVGHVIGGNFNQLSSSGDVTISFKRV